MADPTKPEIDYSYTGWQQEQQENPFPGTQLDNDLAELKRGTSDAIDALKDVRRSDGALKNGIVTRDSLAPDVNDIVGSSAYTIAVQNGFSGTEQQWLDSLKGDPGDPGQDGATTSVTVGSVTTGAPGSTASVTNSGDAENVVLDFVIPRGQTGATGDGSGDMTASTYDPNAIGGDAFSMENMAEGVEKKIFTASERSKLATVAENATANSADATLLARANHTGTQAISTVSGLQDALDGKMALAGGTLTGPLVLSLTNPFFPIQDETGKNRMADWSNAVGERRAYVYKGDGTTDSSYIRTTWDGTLQWRPFGGASYDIAHAGNIGTLTSGKMDKSGGIFTGGVRQDAAAPFFMLRDDTSKPRAGWFTSAAGSVELYSYDGDGTSNSSYLTLPSTGDPTWRRGGGTIHTVLHTGNWSSYITSGSGTDSYVYATRSAITSATLTVHPSYLASEHYDTNKEDGSGLVYKNVGTSNPSAPAQISKTVSAVTNYYVPSTKIHRPEQHGARHGGSAATNRAALVEMFNAAIYDGNEIDLGSANKIFEIDNTISMALAKKIVVRGSGATIKLNRGASADVDYALQFQPNGVGIDLEGFTVDGNLDTPCPLMIESINSSYVAGQKARLVGVNANNARRSSQAQNVSCGIVVRGWFEFLHMAECFVPNARMASGAGVEGTVGIRAFYIGRDGSSRYPLHKEIVDCGHGPVYSEDTSYTEDMDGIAVFDAIPSAYSDRKLASTVITRFVSKSAWTRGIKVQATNVEIVNPTFVLESSPSGVNGKIHSFIDLQWGDGRVLGGTGYCDGGVPTYAVAGNAMSHTDGTMIVDGFKVFGRHASIWSISELVARNADSGHMAGGLIVRNCSTEWVVPDHIAWFKSRVSGTERVLVEGNTCGYVGASAVHMSGSGSNTIIAQIQNNSNRSNTVPLYTSDSCTPSIQGSASSNHRFT